MSVPVLLKCAAVVVLGAVVCGCGPGNTAGNAQTELETSRRADFQKACTEALEAADAVDWSVSAIGKRAGVLSSLDQQGEFIPDLLLPKLMADKLTHQLLLLELATAWMNYGYDSTPPRQRCEKLLTDRLEGLQPALGTGWPTDTKRLLELAAYIRSHRNFASFSKPLRSQYRARIVATLVANDTGIQGAMRELERAPFGHVLLWLLRNPGREVGLVVNHPPGATDVHRQGVVSVVSGWLIPKLVPDVPGLEDCRRLVNEHLNTDPAYCGKDGVRFVLDYAVEETGEVVKTLQGGQSTPDLKVSLEIRFESQGKQVGPILSGTGKHSRTTHFDPQQQTLAEVVIGSVADEALKNLCAPHSKLR
ncbi:MAG: hypothetical protein KF754_14300 [Planctomycetes bacterium]|nr:hypothetical protein [Planctomycetota bacterium]